MSSLVNERSWLDIVRSSVPDLNEQPKAEQAQGPACEEAAVFCCPNCNAPVGATNGQQLTAGAIIITSPTKLACVACHKSYEWSPAA
jgi:hypothetical protein